MFTNANSDIEANMNTVMPKNQISLALMYETLGNCFVCPDDRVMKVNMVDVPKVTRGAEASACNQKVTQDVQTSMMEGM